MKLIGTLKDFVEVVLQVCANWNALASTTHPWFRGQSDASWGLLPRLYRDRVAAHREREMLRDFKLRATAFVERSPENDMELFFIMQHYGMATRLLDWTESHLYALFFAVADDEAPCDGAIWMLEPSSLNAVASASIGRRVPMSNAKIFANYTFDVDANPIVRTTRAADTLAVRPLRSTPRIVAQRGMFTIHGSNDIALDQYVLQEQKTTAKLDHIIIDGNRKRELKKELLLAGVSYSSLFPDLAGLCREIEYRYSEPYLNLDRA